MNIISGENFFKLGIIISSYDFLNNNPFVPPGKGTLIILLLAPISFLNPVPGKIPS